MPFSAALLPTALVIAFAEAPANGPQPPASGEVVRLVGEMDAPIQNGDRIRSGVAMIDTPLPDGYPMPTPPGAVELKTYPTVRRAEITSSTNMSFGANAAFWPLFNHISRRDIAMTSPVEMDLRGMSSEPGDGPDEWTMSFLYRTADLGPTGQEGTVQVVDAPPVTVLAVGFTGSADIRSVGLRLGELEEWMAAALPGYEQAGEPRLLQYNGPSVRWRYRWGEVQIPVRPVSTTEDTAAPDASTAE